MLACMLACVRACVFVCGSVFCDPENGTSGTRAFLDGETSHTAGSTDRHVPGGINRPVPLDANTVPLIRALCLNQPPSGLGKQNFRRQRSLMA